MASQEICNNGIDDDSDGLIDLNDETECFCNAIINGEVESLIPNPSFEDHHCIPETFSELNCADNWVQATEATSDYFVVEGDNFTISSMPYPLPDGNCVAGFITLSFVSGSTFFNYEEYVGSCLLSPMESGTLYTMQMDLAGSSIEGDDTEPSIGVFYGPIDITLYGSASCPTWPITTNTGCPIGFGDWQELGHISYQADGTWQQVTITFIPTFDVQAVMIGGPCTLPEDFAVEEFSFSYPYFWIDNIVLNTSASFSNSIYQTGSSCTENIVLHGQLDSTFTSMQWYHDGIALPGETDSLLNISELGLPLGTYQFQTILNDTSCAVSVFEVLEPIEINPEISADQTIGCAPFTTTFQMLNADDVSSFSWSFGDGQTSNDETPTHIYQEPGIFDVTIMVTSDEGCTYQSIYDDMITVLEPPLSAFVISALEGCSPLEVVIENTSEFADAFAWSLGDGSMIETEDPGIFAHQYLSENQSITYTVQLISMREPNCADTSFASLTVSLCGCVNPDAINFNPLASMDDGSCVLPEPYIFIPNVFTPNQDAQNARFEIKNEYLKYIRLVVYDRWGNLVYEKESNSPDSSNPAWDGTHGGTDASEGVYYFLYEAQGLNDQTFDGEGFFHLLRDH